MDPHFHQIIKIIPSPVLKIESGYDEHLKNIRVNIDNIKTDYQDIYLYYANYG